MPGAPRSQNGTKDRGKECQTMDLGSLHAPPRQGILKGGVSHRLAQGGRNANLWIVGAL